jgi:hypothetical protein
MSCCRGLCCMFCILLLVACLAVGAAGHVLHVLFPSSCGVSCCRGCRAFPGLSPTLLILKNKKIFMRSPSCVFVCVTSPIFARQRFRKHVLAATKTHTTTDEMFEAVLSVRCPSYLIFSMLCKESRRLHLFHPSGG